VHVIFNVFYDISHSASVHSGCFNNSFLLFYQNNAKFTIRSCIDLFEQYI
jgi:hypothetical protein